MRYAVVSDIHSNLQAWNAVLLDIRASDVDEIISLGDLIGYGPNPVEVLESAYVNIDHFVLGNHDAVVCGKMDGALFNDKARKLISWTQSQLGKEASRFLKRLPLSLCAETFRCAHGDFSQPAAFNYVIEPEDALKSWAAVKEPLLFTGHTHRPAIFLLGQSGTPHVVGPQDFVVEEGKRYLVNVGSVGQPRDGESRAIYCIYDTEDQSVRWRRVLFDLFSYRKSMEQAGLDPQSSYFLRHDPTKDLPPLREILNFSPARTPAEGVQDAVEVQELNQLKRSRNRWRNLSILIAALSLLAAAAGTGAWWLHATRAMEIVGAGAAPINAITAQPDENLLRMPDPAQAGPMIAGWNVHLGNKRRQTVEVSIEEGESAFVLTSGTARDEMWILSPPVRVSYPMKVRAEALFKKSDDFDGSITVAVSLAREINGKVQTTDHFIIKGPTERRKEGWFLGGETKDLLANSVSLQYSLRGKFTGTIRVRDVRLVKK